MFSPIKLQVNPADVIILEGILVLHDHCIRDLMNMKIFVDTGSFLSLFPCYLLLYDGSRIFVYTDIVCLSFILPYSFRRL